MACFDLDRYLDTEVARVNAALDRFLPASSCYPEVISQAMRYSTLAGGKRLRPILLLASAAAVGCVGDQLLPAACALECLHTYSLIHDDLPALDNDDLRRGKPTSHKVFGDAMAVLAGDALLTFSFQLLSQGCAALFPPERLVMAISELATAAGVAGMVGGQVADVQWERGLLAGDPATVLEYIHRHKTGAILESSVRIGAILSGATAVELESLSSYARHLGLAFQIADDLLDVTGEEEKLGKRVQKDSALGKLTYPSIHGVARSLELNQELLAFALGELQSFGQSAEPLRALARYLVTRDH